MLDIFLGIIGGLGLFLFGMHILTSSLKSLSLEKIKQILDKTTNNRIKAFFVGTGITALIQSSSATSVILIGFLNVGLIKLTSAVPMIFGANIGTTITAQLIAFKLTKIAPVFIFAGAAIFFAAKKNKHKNIGLAILGFGLLFFGLEFMSSSVKPLSSEPSILGVFQEFGKWPILGILVGLVVTVLFQSSSTTIGMVIALSSAGLLDFRAAFFIVLGDNIGTCITAVIASIGGSHSAKRLALAHTLFNVIGTLIALIIAPLYLSLIPLTSDEVARQIANAHTIFNIFNAIIFLPFVPLFVKLLNRLIKGRDYYRKEGRYLDDNLSTSPELALNAVKKEMVIMLSVCREMLDKVRRCSEKFDHKIKSEIEVDEDSIDELQKNITKYIVKITHNSPDENHSRQIPILLHNVNDIERIGDHCFKIMKAYERMYENDCKFSVQAKKEISSLFNRCDMFFALTIRAIDKNDLQAALESFSIEDKIDTAVRDAKDNHIRRLQNNECLHESGLVYTELLRRFEKIGDNLNNVSEGVLKANKADFDDKNTKAYLEE